MTRRYGMSLEEFLSAEVERPGSIKRIEYREGQKIWWFGPFERIRRVDTEKGSEWWVDLLPTDQIYFHRSIKCTGWNHARAALANPWDHY